MSGITRYTKEEIIENSNTLSETFKRLESLRVQFPLTYNDQVIRDVDTYTANLMRKFGIKRYNSYFSLLTTNAYPYLSIQELILTNNGIAVLWLVDDFVDDMDDLNRTTDKKIEFCEEILQYLCGNHVAIKYSNNRFISLLESDEFWVGYRNAPIAKRYLRKLSEMIQYGMLPKLRYGNKQMPLDTYLQMRYYDCGCECCWVFMDFDNEIPECESTRMGNFVIWAVNDLYSYWKDVLRDGTYYNYLCCSQDVTNLKSLCDQLSNRITDSWNKLNNLVTFSSSIAVKVDIWARANLIWHEGCPRYWRPKIDK